ncbi:primosomal protein N' [Sulfurifustis variabilis]|uniref:Replication restart protein PriA n=1 Tax=Sulfurifustis variabilis TaxID=1675686 RepID=A0A1B4V071_9GAMM|nr:primosomal protein N' [Sulfurifustis variabilis]BAU46653.1 primosomal protein N' [Sulfurifustis variabilis]
MSETPRIVQVAVPAPLRRTFDYLPPSSGDPRPGVRVRVPLGRGRAVVGVVTGTATASSVPTARLKAVLGVLDEEPLLPPEVMDLLTWAADYYHHPIGEVMQSALPVRLRGDRPASAAGDSVWAITAAGRAVNEASLNRTPLRLRLLSALKKEEQGLTADELVRISARWQAGMKALVAAGWVARRERDCLAPVPRTLLPPPALNAAQADAVRAVLASRAFRVFLLHGVTGSGKTEVYLRAIEAVLATGRQTLVLVPEIALTPQLVDRFRSRFGVAIAVLHSGLSDGERACGWLSARAGKAAIVLGTRSAVFTPLPRLGLIVVDEEHDGSYKQQDGFRYSGRDVAVMRARRSGVPIVLGSATPSLESLYQVQRGRYAYLSLPDRAGAANPPALDLLDMRRLAPDESLSRPLRQAIGECLARREQAMLFLNRRGFAPVWFCPDCGWLAPCSRCDARLTLHRASARLRCHHCGAEGPVPKHCPACGSERLRALGEGTERVEGALQRMFPEARIVRIDRDTTRRKGSLESAFARVRAGEADILVGTQMLAKGHDFPNVTLVGVINADQGLYSVDFRAGERLFQQIVQVSGRAGRAEKPGRVLIQTYHPDHGLFGALRLGDYRQFADDALLERREAGYPPFSFLALLRAESSSPGGALKFLGLARSLAERCPRAELEIMDPVPSPMERRAGRHRAQLLVQSRRRAPLHAFLREWLSLLEEAREARRVRWSLDVDPADLY